MQLKATHQTFLKAPKQDFLNINVFSAVLCSMNLNNDENDKYFHAAETFTPYFEFIRVV